MNNMSNQENTNLTQFAGSSESAAFAYERWREAFLRVVMRGASVVGIFLVINTILQKSPTIILTTYISIFTLLIIVTFTRSPYIVRAIVFAGIIYTVGLVILMGWGINADGSMYLLGFIGIMALLFDYRTGIIANIITFTTIMTLGWLASSGNFKLLVSNLSPGTIADWLTSAIDVVGVGVVLTLAAYYLKREFDVVLIQVRQTFSALTKEQTNLEERVKERTNALLIANQQVEKRARQLQVVAEVARTATSIQELNQLLNPLTVLISQRFGYYHVGIFLLDEQNQYAVLEASNTEGGLIMLKRGHRLKVAEQGIVGFVTSRGEPRIALDVGQDAVFFDNANLPNTRSELALPLKISEKIIGALDLQSIEERAFTEEDISVLTILADQVAIAIQNARSAERARRALLEAEVATKQLSGEAWKDYTEKSQTRGYRYDGVKPEPLNNRETSEDKDALLIPVQLRGQTIGRLKLKALDANRNWTDDERAIIESTAERVALAMESARLLNEAQKRATRESFLSDIGTKLGASFQLDSILRDTVEELGQTLKGSTVSFQLVNPSAPPTAETSKADGASARRKKSE